MHKVVQFTVRYEWDEQKRQRTIKERALDFADADLFFDGRPILTQQSVRGGEERHKTTAIFAGKYITLIWVWRNEAVRIISVRRAHAKEIRAHRKLYNG